MAAGPQRAVHEGPQLQLREETQHLQLSQSSMHAVTEPIMHERPETLDSADQVCAVQHMSFYASSLIDVLLTRFHRGTQTGVLLTSRSSTGVCGASPCSSKPRAPSSSAGAAVCASLAAAEGPLTSSCALAASGSGDAWRSVPRCSDATLLTRRDEHACAGAAGSCMLPRGHAAAAGLQRVSERISSATCSKPLGMRCIWGWLLLLLLLLLLTGCISSYVRSGRARR